MQNQCAEIKLRAERRAGELLREMPKAKGKRTDLVTSCHQVGKPTLDDIGISKKQSSRWQLIANLPEAEFEAYISEYIEAERKPRRPGEMIQLVHLVVPSTAEAACQYRPDQRGGSTLLAVRDSRRVGIELVAEP